MVKYDTTAPVGQVDLWSDVLPTGRDILWPSVIQLQVRLTCLLEMTVAVVIPAVLAYIKVVAVKKLILHFVFICLDD